MPDRAAERVRDPNCPCAPYGCHEHGPNGCVEYLDPEEFARVLDILHDPPPPTDALKKLMRIYRTIFGISKANQMTDILPTVRKRMAVAMEQNGYVVGIREVPSSGETDYALIVSLLRALADKIEKCARDDELPTPQVWANKLAMDIGNWRDHEISVGIGAVPDFWDERNTSERLAEWLAIHGYKKVPR